LRHRRRTDCDRRGESREAISKALEIPHDARLYGGMT
jgi:hypothetical protein